MYRKL